MQLMEITERAKTQIAKATGLEPVMVPGAARDNEGWCVTVEMVEFHRIPDAQDVIGVYEVRLNDDGELLEWRRVGQHKRGDTGWESE